jgi:hypothetical protein
VAEITFVLGEGLSYPDDEARQLADHLASERIRAGLDIATKMTSLQKSGYNFSSSP